MTSIAKRITEGIATLDSHVLSLTAMEARQLADLFEPSDLAKLKVTSHMTSKEWSASTTQSVSVPFVLLEETTFRGTRGIWHLHGAMRALYDLHRESSAQPLFQKIRALKIERQEKERGLRYLELIVNAGIEQKKLFKRRTD